MIPDLVPSSLLAPMGRQEGKPFPAEEDWEDLRMGEGTVPTVGSWGQPTTCPFQEDTISINHNWVNGCNLANMWHFLQQELCAVQQEVSEWRDTMPDWHHHCQVGRLAWTGVGTGRGQGQGKVGSSPGTRLQWGEGWLPGLPIRGSVWG